MSRRDFFARVSGRDQAPSEAAAAEEDESGALYSFFVAGFPYHSGPVLVPMLRAGDEFRLTTEPLYSRTPTAVRIERGRDLLGYVPEAATTDLLDRLAGGERLLCRAVRVDPTAELASVLFVEIREVEPVPEEADITAAAAPSDETPAIDSSAEGAAVEAATTSTERLADGSEPRVGGSDEIGIENGIGTEPEDRT